MAVDEFLSLACKYENYLQIVVLTMVFLFLLTLFSLVLGTPGTAAYTIALFDAGLAFVFGGFCAVLLYHCVRNKPDGPS